MCGECDSSWNVVIEKSAMGVKQMLVIEMAF